MRTYESFAYTGQISTHECQPMVRLSAPEDQHNLELSTRLMVSRKAKTCKSFGDLSNKIEAHNFQIDSKL